jgi:glycosyltransferase involved in cell wall biosynthesis
MKVVVTIAAINPRHGGPARTVPGLCRGLGNQGADVELVTVAERGRTMGNSVNDGFVTTAISTDSDRYHPRSWAKQFKEKVSKAVRAKDAILYDVGVWLPSNHFAARVAAETNTPFVISPRGMLSDQALNVSKWKKRIAWNLYQRRDLKRANVLHATSEKEAEEFRALNLEQPIAVVPNGVDVPAGIDTSHFTRDTSRTILFLSRLHPIKGLQDLVAAWARVRPKKWRVVVAGPNENNHRGQVEALAESLGVRRDFDFVGPVDDEKKWKLLNEADLFVLPSYSESFGMAIAEALAAGVPVITTKATPWREIETHQCGWWVNTGAESIAAALQSATACDCQELRAMGQRGRDLVKTKYSWESAAKKLLSVFEWVLGRGHKPACVI